MAEASLPTLHTLLLHAGEKVVLPSGATIRSIAIDGDLQVTTSCPDLEPFIDAAERYECYQFAYGVDNDNNDTHPMDNAHLQYFKIAGVTYNMGNRYLWDALVAPTLYDYIKEKMTFYGASYVMNVLAVIRTINFDKRKEYSIIVKMPPSLAAQAEMFITGNGFADGLYIKPASADCP
jgi:hypothetical protein